MCVSDLLVGPPVGPHHLGPSPGVPAALVSFPVLLLSSLLGNLRPQLGQVVLWDFFLEATRASGTTGCPASGTASGRGGLGSCSAELQGLVGASRSVCPPTLPRTGRGAEAQRVQGLSEAMCQAGPRPLVLSLFLYAIQGARGGVHPALVPLGALCNQGGLAGGGPYSCVPGMGTWGGQAYGGWCMSVFPGRRALTRWPGASALGGGSGSLEDTLAQSELGSAPETTHWLSSALLVPGATLGTGHAAASRGHVSTARDCHITRRGPQVCSALAGDTEEAVTQLQADVRLMPSEQSRKGWRVQRPRASADTACRKAWMPFPAPESHPPWVPGTGPLSLSVIRPQLPDLPKVWERVDAAGSQGWGDLV